MEHPDRSGPAAGRNHINAKKSSSSHLGPCADIVVILVAAAIFVGCCISPPHLMDDVDSVQATIARNMLHSGDYVTARLDGIAYLEKSPLIYWTMAASYAIFGVHDWAARLPLALLVVLLCWITARFSAWAFGAAAGLYSGLVLATCVGLFLFTRILIPDAQLTLVIALAMWAFLRVLDEAEPRPRLWAATFAACLGIGLLLKGLISVVFPIGAIIVYFAITRAQGTNNLSSRAEGESPESRDKALDFDSAARSRPTVIPAPRQLFHGPAWKRLHPFSGLLILLAIAAPWHILAVLRNPPYFAWSMHSGPDDYKGFLWFYFMNEHVLRFLNMRYPRDYDTVPRLLFWGFHLIWLFPWSFYFPAIARLSFKPSTELGAPSYAPPFARRVGEREGGETPTVVSPVVASPNSLSSRAEAVSPQSRDNALYFDSAPPSGATRAARTRLLALCWIGVVMVFFTFSTTQEYYSLPIYPALALLLGCALASEDPITARWVQWGTKAIALTAGAALLVIIGILFEVRHTHALGDISSVLAQHPEMYTLSMGHMGDLTLRSFAYLRLPLVMAAIALGIGMIGAWMWSGQRHKSTLALSCMMVLFFHAARLAMVSFDNYLGSKPLADALQAAPPGQLIAADTYYSFSSVFFYTDRDALLLDGRINNLEYGSNAPGAPQVFIGDDQFLRLWASPQRCYLLAYGTTIPRLAALVGESRMKVVKESGGNFLMTNQ